MKHAPPIRDDAAVPTPAPRTPAPRTPAASLAATAGAVVAVFLAASCGDARAPRECLAGEPRAIFTPADSTVVAHDFRPAGQASLETVAFADGLLLALAQRGCDTLVQDFTLAGARLPTDYAAFVPAAAATFYALGGLDPRLGGFSEYGRILSSVPGDAPEGRPVDLAPGLSVRITGLPTPAQTSWRVVYTQDLGVARVAR